MTTLLNLNPSAAVILLDGISKPMSGCPRILRHIHWSWRLHITHCLHTCHSCSVTGQQNIVMCLPCYRRIRKSHERESSAKKGTNRITTGKLMETNTLICGITWSIHHKCSCT
jgi:hypothetical protein